MKIKLMFFPKNESFSWIDLEDVESMMPELFTLKGDRLLLQDNPAVLYKIHLYKKSVVLELKKEAENEDSARALSLVANKIEKGGHRKDHNIIYLWDDVSQYYGKKLFPLLSHYERRLREIIYFTLIQALEHQWYSHTVTAELDRKIKAKRKQTEKGNNSNVIEEALEEFTLYEYKEYLLEKRWPYNFEEKLDELIEKVHPEKNDTEEIIQIIQDLEKKALWERYFDSEIGFDLKENLENVREIRNIVMHHKKISYNNFEEYQQVLDRSNTELDMAIHKLYSDNYNEIPLEDLSNFVTGILEASKIAAKATMSSLENLPQIMEPYIEMSRQLAEFSRPVVESISELSIPNTSKENSNHESQNSKFDNEEK